MKNTQLGFRIALLAVIACVHAAHANGPDFPPSVPEVASTALLFGTAFGLIAVGRQIVNRRRK